MPDYTNSQYPSLGHHLPPSFPQHKHPNRDPQIAARRYGIHYPALQRRLRELRWGAKDAGTLGSMKVNDDADTR
jgi:hypothetical protein